MNTFENLGFAIERTGDQSPSLRLREVSSQPGSAGGLVATGESMHHSGGAFSETALIYGVPINEVLTRDRGGRFLVVGLGLGYVEMMIAAESLKRGVSAQDVFILSFESVQGLTDNFINWIFTQESDVQLEQRAREQSEQKVTAVPSEGVVAESPQGIYNEMAHLCVGESGYSVFQLREFLQKVYLSQIDANKKGSRIEGALTLEVVQNWPKEKIVFDCILYDAFSSKTSPSLWDEEFLVAFLQNLASDRAFFSTYACRGTLKRALARTGFTIEICPGFMGKRNSTRGRRPFSSL